MKNNEKMREGFLEGGMPYVAMGDGPPLVYMRSLPLSERMYKYELNILPLLAPNFTVYAVDRKPGIKKGATMRDLASGYARAIESEFGEAVNVMGLSSGGAIAMQFAIDFPHLVRKLVLVAIAYRVGSEGLKLELKYADLLAQGRFRDAARVFYPTVFAESSFSQWLLGGIIWLAEPLFLRPTNPEDTINTLLADENFNVEEDLHKITAPTLLIGGERDFFFPEKLLKHTADLIPNSRLIVYPGRKHIEVETDSRFAPDVVSFLNNENSI
ncbi:MAG: alpha/beta hydrolase [Euryarchaeota archaeon]|nr:alpha/beta hydrolase [Euryarchaeota archaeon]